MDERRQEDFPGDVDGPYEKRLRYWKDQLRQQQDRSCRLIALCHDHGLSYDDIGQCIHLSKTGTRNLGKRGKMLLNRGYE